MKAFAALFLILLASTVSSQVLDSAGYYINARVFVKAFLSFEIHGNVQSGKDDVEVDLVNGKWMISSP